MELVALDIYWQICDSNHFHIQTLTITTENRFRYLSTRKTGYLNRYLNGELYK
jgi:hypothetical protein